MRVLRWLVVVTLCVLLLPGMVLGAYSESPLLTGKVAAGELPPLADRLPLEPFVAGSGTLIPEGDLDWQVGVFGGVWTSAHVDPEINSDFANLLLEPLLDAPGLTTEGIRGNIVQGFSVNETSTVFTFTMREGMRWSDGVPLTTDDIRFTYEDVLLNETLTPAVPTWLRSGGRAGGTPLQIEIIDDYTFTITFDEPYGGFLAELAITGWKDYSTILKPKHYLKQFHIDYTPLEDMAEQLASQELEDEWWQLFGMMDIAAWQTGMERAVGFPTLRPWIGVYSPAGMVEYERNPYYHKVDTAGQQLPYIDKLQSYEVVDLEALTMRIFTGEMDYNRSYTALNKMDVYVDNEERGGYKTLVLDHHCPTVLTLNQTFDDPVWREVVQDVRFRQALNLAIDREEITASIYFGFASQPRHTPGGYDPVAAGELLDAMGMDQRDDEGFRLSPSGERFYMVIEFANWAPDFVPMAELLTEHFRAVDINASMRTISGELRGIRGTGNELMATLGWLHSELWADEAYRDYLPGEHWPGQWAPRWSQWYNSQGRDGEEPPEHVKEMYRLHEAVVATVPHSDDGAAAMKALLDWHYENITFLIPVESVGYPMTVTTTLKNMPESGYAIAANRSGEQFFFEK